MPTPESGTGVVPDAATAEHAFYDIARWRLDEQLRRADALDARVANMFYLIAALAPLFGALLVFSDTEGIARVLYVLAVGVYFAVVALTVAAYGFAVECAPRTLDAPGLLRGLRQTHSPEMDRPGNDALDSGQ